MALLTLYFVSRGAVLSHAFAPRGWLSKRRLVFGQKEGLVAMIPIRVFV